MPIVYIPVNLDLDSLIELYPPVFKPFHKDSLLYILHLISNIPLLNKKVLDKMEDGFTPIHKPTLQNYLRNYNDHIDYLVLLGITEKNTHYKVAELSSGLRFTAMYHGQQMKPVEITKKNLVDRITKNESKHKESATLSYPYLTKWFERNLIEIDQNEAESFLYNLYEANINSFGVEKADLNFKSNHVNVLKLAHGEFRYGVDPRAKRLHSNLTNLKKELRNFITYGGQRLGSVDLKNSQPYLLQAIFEPKPFKFLEVEKKIRELNPKFHFDFKSISGFTSLYGGQFTSMGAPIAMGDVLTAVSGSTELGSFRSSTRQGIFYEEYGKTFFSASDQNEPTQISKEFRALAKKGMFSVLFSENRAISYSAEMKKFKAEFPLIFAFISAIKRGQHNTLSLTLQWVEAKMMLGIICSKISQNHPNIPLFTIHDSIITTIPHLDIVENQIKTSFKEVFGDSPEVTKEIWSPTKE